VLAALVHGVVSGLSPHLLPALMLFLSVGLTGLFLTGDVFSFYVFFELATAAPCRRSRPSWPERWPASAPTGCCGSRPACGGSVRAWTNSSSSRVSS
jgi:hypothetical protein